MEPEIVTVNFLHVDFAQKIVLALCVGLFVGLERESASKDVGVRTFALTALLGLTCQIVNPHFAIGGLVSVLFLTAYMNVRAMLVSRSLEITTSAAILITYCLGVLVAMGHVFTPVAATVLMTMLLAWKSELAAFAHGLRLAEIQSAVMIGLLSFVIYPILPNTYVDPWELLNPREAWVTVIVLAGISFVNYLLLKIYSTRGLYYSALLGGAVNSSAAVTEITQAIKLPGGGIVSGGMAILLMTTLSMFVRNLFLLGLFEPTAIAIAAAPLAGMSIATAIAIAAAPLAGMSIATVYFIQRARKMREKGLAPTAPLNLSSPVSLRRVLKFALLFIALHAAGSLGQRYMGSFGVLAVSFLGGLVSSASTTAAAAKLASQGKITATVAGIATILTSISSAFVNLPLVYQLTKDKSLTRSLGLTTLMCILSGLIMMAAVAWAQHWS